MSGDDKGLNWQLHSTVVDGQAVANVSSTENEAGARMYSVCFQRLGRTGPTRYFRLGDLDALIAVATEVRKRFSENAAKREEQRRSTGGKT